MRPSEKKGTVYFVTLNVTFLFSNRSRSTRISPCLTKEEKALVKVASEAPEQFDSISKVLDEAKRAAEWIKSSKYCVAFTGKHNQEVYFQS